MNPLGYLADLLDRITANETTTRTVYGGTRGSDGVYSVTASQSEDSTYAAGATRTDRTRDRPSVDRQRMDESKTRHPRHVSDDD